MKSFFSRRSLIKGIGVGTLAVCGLPVSGSGDDEKEVYRIKNRRVRQSVIYWCYRPMPVEELARHASRLGLQSVELVTQEHWPALKRLGLICAMSPSHGFAKGFAQKSEHEECLAVLRQRIDACSEAGFPSVITFSGYRRGLTDDDATKNMEDGLKQIVPYAEEKGINLCLEVLNSRVSVEMKGHPDYFCDHLEPAVELCRKIGSERLKILFDIYHVQIMEGDLIRRIQQFHPYVAHFHTGGNPGRNEIDATQEITYPALMKAILDTGYNGYVGHEFIPTRDKIASLSEAARICDV
jgi:hydroxypyruvate isomerase